MFRRYSFWLIVILFLIYVLSFVDRQIVAVLAPQIRAHFELTNVQIGLLYGTAFSLIYAVAGIPMGRLADQWSRRKMIAIAVFAWSLVTVLSGFATSFAMLVVYRLILGVSQAMLSPAAYALLAETFRPELRASIFSVYASAIFIGIGLSFLVGGTVAQNTDWQTAMVVVGLPGLLLAPVACFFIRDVRVNRFVAGTFVGDIFASLRDMLGKRTIQLHLLGFGMLGVIGYTVLAFISIIFVDVFERPDLIRHYGWFQLGVAVTVIFMGLLADYLARKNPARRFWIGIIAIVAALPLYGLGLFADDGFTALILLGTAVLFSFSFNGVAAALIQFMVRPDQRALAGAVYLFVMSVGGLGLGPPIAGFLMDRAFEGQYAASQAIFSLIIVCATIAIISFVAAMRSYHRDAVD
ncbi:Major Facilitator Superfamily protein [Ectothiorhodosinus mongolicus]|uniref:Major Facilitator Superfamily protein n=1 Tax=Ectothiorhodosinus mongolicus TaxID=233100 RepID=A0A1R3VM30_9GAMM|nr:MFS transporter [Ectothiorhodosinus mongolicus]ULX57754.1 MFS transporter [Ectothiorhodosinus mongolicus]SIT65617.1 Major Facilitator Superfamily protein [Ectothiorhodosinus mongolicus]